MEILSIGDKIKRARIYAGLTLKEVCEDKISVSKLSCIENNKIKPEKKIIKYLSKKLQMDEEYLKEGVKDQLSKNLQYLKENKGLNKEEYEKGLIYNLNFAKENKYYDTAFEFMHLIFNYYLDNKKNNKIYILISDYYEICERVYYKQNRITYYMDMGKYCFVNKEYKQAITFYKQIRNKIEDDLSNNEKIQIYIKVVHNESACHLMLQQYEQAYEIISLILDKIECLDDSSAKGEIYQSLAILSIKLSKESFTLYEEKSYKCYKNDDYNRARAIYNYAIALCEIGAKEIGIKYIHKALKCFPKYDKNKLAKFMIIIVKALIDNDLLEMAEEICAEALNLSIKIDEVKYIERAYYYKAIILIKNNNYAEAEICINLSLDFLKKSGTLHQIYERYLEMGNMYHDMSNINDSIKYFTLALNLGEKL